jgi:hypothetical protein
MSAITEIETLASKLRTERARLLSAVGGLEAGEFTRPFGEGWSVKDILAHLAAAEELNVKFAKMMVSQERPVQLREFAADYPDFTGSFSLDGFNAYLTAKLHSIPLRDVLNQLQETRAVTLAWVETLTADQLGRGGQHAVWGDQTVRGMLRILALHERVHTRDILKRSGQVDG